MNIKDRIRMDTGLIRVWTRTTAGCSQCGKANTDYVEGEEFLNQISNHQLLKQKREREKYVDIPINTERQRNTDMDTQAERYRGTHTSQQVLRTPTLVVLIRE
jgi:hypothetical protein